MPDSNDAKRELRRTMRSILREIGDREDRSRRISDALWSLIGSSGDGPVMLYEALPEEPDLAALATRLRRHGRIVVAPPSRPDAVAPVEASGVDVVVVPGLGFTRHGERIGRGGGWYDRFLSGRRADCFVVGACFDAQIVESVPREPHDVTMDAIVSESGAIVLRRP